MNLNQLCINHNATLAARMVDLSNLFVCSGHNGVFPELPGTQIRGQCPPLAHLDLGFPALRAKKERVKILFRPQYPSCTVISLTQWPFHQYQGTPTDY